MLIEIKLTIEDIWILSNKPLFTKEHQEDFMPDIILGSLLLMFMLG